MDNFKENLIDAYRLGEPGFYYYSVLKDYLLKKASQGYRILPIESIVKDIGYNKSIVERWSKLLGLEIEPYWEGKGVRLVPETEPNKLKT